jgi:hypothetical protein
MSELYEDVMINGVNVGPLPPTFSTYQGMDAFFDGVPPLSVSVGYLVVLGFGVGFSVITTALVCINSKFGISGDVTSEHFKYVIRDTNCTMAESVI